MKLQKFIQQEALNVLDTFQPSKRVRKIKPVRIKYKGQFITLNSGKTIWKRIGDARSALRHHFDGCNPEDKLFVWMPNTEVVLGRWDKQHYTYEERRAILKELYQEVLKNVEFVEVDE